MGGVGIKIRVDETAICNGRLIANSSSEYDNQSGIQWIRGVVKENDSKKFFLKLIPVIKIETLRAIFDIFVNSDTWFYTDCYPWYPSAIRQFGSAYYTIKYSQGFITSDGIHNNRIANLWVHLKQQYKARNGIIT